MPTGPPRRAEVAPPRKDQTCARWRGSDRLSGAGWDCEAALQDRRAVCSGKCRAATWKTEREQELFRLTEYIERALVRIRGRQSPGGAR